MRAFAFLMIGVVLGGCFALTPEAEPTTSKPAHHLEEGFRNLYVQDGQKNFFDFLKLKYFSDYEWADQEKTADQVPIQKLDVARIQSADPDVLHISWLGHSTFLLQKNGVNILTDPVFGNRVSPVFFAGPKRLIPHVVAYEDLPRIDYVVISHNHYDHLDLEAVRKLGNEPIYLVPLKLKAWYLSAGIRADRVREFDWWDELIFDTVTIQALPSQHWSARGLFDRRMTLWASWSLKMGDDKIWFAGDTGYNEVQFREIGDKTGPYDVALIPIGAYEPRSFMKTYHVNPEEAILLHQDVQAQKSFGMHWGTFQLTAEDTMAPVVELEKQKQIYGLRDQEFDIMAVGETVSLGKQIGPEIAAQSPLMP